MLIGLVTLRVASCPVCRKKRFRVWFRIQHAVCAIVICSHPVSSCTLESVARSDRALSLFSLARSRLVANGNALGFTAVAQPPTVTLPRLKALTTGSNPTFLDAILNVADEGGASAHSAAALDRTDSWLRQFVLRGGDGGERILNKVAFAGDDTWLRLFPRDWFAWSDGVSSFFVSVSVSFSLSSSRGARLLPDLARLRHRTPKRLIRM